MGILVPNPQPQPQAPGNYPGQGQAKLINANHQYYLWANHAVPAITASVAVQLERQKSASYPFGAAFEVAFSADPGVFELQIQGAEDDIDSHYVSIGTITAVNASFVGRLDLVEKYVKFVRGYVASITNSVAVTLKVTR